MEHRATRRTSAGGMNTAELGDCLSALPQNFLTTGRLAKRGKLELVH